MALKVQDQSPEVAAMSQAWHIVEALLGGTAAMRAAGETYLPRWPNEDPASYKTRLGTATLFPALARTVSVMLGKPFAKQLTLGDDVPPKIAEWLEDADLQGNSVHPFLSGVFREALGFGLCGVLVDAPRVGPDVRTQKDEEALGVRPYLVFIRHSQILGWKAGQVGGATVLTQLRLAETKQVDDGDFGVKLERRVRVLTPGAWAVYMPGAKAEDEWVVEDEGTTTLKAIPFVPFYGEKTGFMCGASPLLDLAYLNVKHWQSQSDQDTILHVARVPILMRTGVEGSDTKPLTVGSGTAVDLPMGATMEYVEHTGKAIEAGAKSLNDLEEHMVQTGAELMVKRPGQVRTATQDNNEAEANKSDLQRMVESCEDSLDQVLQFMAMWVGEKQGGHASLFKDFSSSNLSDASAQLILSMQQGGLLSKPTTLREMQRRGTLSPDLLPETELEAIQEEGPALGTLGDPGNLGGGSGNGQ